jgi:hypothetical protein
MQDCPNCDKQHFNMKNCTGQKTISKGREMSNMQVTRFTETGIMQSNEEGGWERPEPIPFMLWSFGGGWKHACVPHKLLFQFKSRWHKHGHHEPKHTSEYPPSDLAIRAGYKRVWLP